jgi:dTDP-4-dehydrorhamnose reductase
LKSIKKKIVITGGQGRFAQTLKHYTKLNIYYPNKKELNILSYKSIENYIKKIKPKYILHAAALSRPMNIHDKNIALSINLNIIGTANIVKACEKFKIKLIYFSTNYVYPGKKGNYRETDPLLPINSYAWSKLGGKCSVKLYKNSLIVRLCMCEKPFIHKYAFSDIKTNFMFHEDFVKIIPKILNKKGILNAGGKIQTIYDFAKKSNPMVKKKSGRKVFPPNPSMNISKMKKFI